MSDREVIIRPMADVLREEGALNRIEAMEHPIGEGKPGGRYLVNGVLCDANGNPVDDKKAPRPEDLENPVPSFNTPAPTTPAPTTPPTPRVDEGEFADVSFADLKAQADEMGIE